MIELFPVFVVLVFSVYRQGSLFYFYLYTPVNRLAKAASKGELGLALRTFISPTDEWGPRFSTFWTKSSYVYWEWFMTDTNWGNVLPSLWFLWKCVWHNLGCFQEMEKRNTTTMHGRFRFLFIFCWKKCFFETLKGPYTWKKVYSKVYSKCICCREDLPSGLQNKAFEEISPSFRQIDPI